ncbi:MAG: hypothetical protein WBH31_00515 [Promethearchaeia archaeon]
MSFIEPSFEIDNKGRVICQFHSQFPFFMKPEKTTLEEEYVDKILTCKTCQHYKENDCFFPKLEINRIETDKRRGHFQCKLCGNKIHRILTIIQKLYVKDRFNIDIPLICCDCYESLKENSLLKNFKHFVSEKKYDPMISFEFLIILGMVAILLAVFLPFLFQFLIIFIIYWIFVLGFYIYYYVRRFYYLRKGKKYYTKFSTN